MRASSIAALILLVSSATALASDEPQSPSNPTSAAQPPTAADEPAELSHRYQFGFGLRFGSGYRIIAPYGKENCGELDEDGGSAAVCNSRYPFWVELSPSFGLTDSLELLVDIRFPLEEPDFTASKGLLISPGIKYYTDPESLMKFFLTAQLAFENQDQSVNDDLKSFDFGLRSALGLQFDLLRYVGLYAQAGLILGFTRWFSALVDFGAGLQVRY